MARLHCRRRTQIQTRIQIPNPMVTLYCVEHVHIAQTQTWIPTPYFCIRQESESVSVFDSGNVNEPLHSKSLWNLKVDKIISLKKFVCHHLFIFTINIFVIRIYLCESCFAS